MKKLNQLLPQDSLKGIRLGVSVSSSDDLARLGLLEEHFKLALAEITRSILTLGGKLAYGGHLDPKGYTAFLMKELERYSRRDKPLLVCLSMSEHRKISLKSLTNDIRDIGLLGEIVCLDIDGRVMEPTDDRDNAATPLSKQKDIEKSLSSMRKFMTENINGRVLIGGKRTGFFGNMPGVLEEALLSVEMGHPIYFAGGFGGITHDIVKALRIDDGSWLPDFKNEHGQDDRLTKGMEELCVAIKATNNQSLENGLNAEENRRLAVTHRPSEIAALISLGLGRKFVDN